MKKITLTLLTLFCLAGTIQASDYKILHNYEDGMTLVLYPNIQVVCLISYGVNSISPIFCWGTENAPHGVKEFLKHFEEKPLRGEKN